MKKLFFIFILISAVETIFAQTDKSRLKLITGFKLLPIDWAGGMCLGLGLNLTDRLEISVRNDFTFNYGKQTVSGDTVVFFSSDKNEIYNYHTFNYFDIEYKISSKRDIYLGLGPGWVFAGGNSTYRLSDQTGYYVLSLTAKIQHKHLGFELRGDIPLTDVPLSVYSGNNIYSELPERIFPVSVSLIYRFQLEK
jgi:hypothetical protein